MSSVDNRIVKMQLENSQFTSAANSTMNTLSKLTNSLKLSEGVKGLENVAKKAKDVDMSGIEAGVETVKNRFSVMEIVGVTALVNVANSAVNAGKRMLSSLTLDPITSGFEEYETKMGAITTILTNTEHAGTKLKDVTAVLDELNLYADQTIYNFAEMTRNIGTFTAAGVDLETSANAIKGIANLAAGSGSTSQQASTAMYQLSQALAAGTLKLQDWNSVVNAGMGGRLFQNALEETAVKLGQGRDMSVSFRDSLQDGWITTEVLTTTLKKFAEDESLLKAATQVKTYTQLIDTMKESVQSGWGQSWELILGDREKAAELFTAISDGFNSIAEPMAKYRNTALKFWNEVGGREAVIKGLSNVMQTIGNLLGPIYKSFIKIIDPWNGKRLVSISKGFENMSSKIKISEDTISKITKTFDAFFTVIKTIGQVVVKIGSAFFSLIPLLAPVAKGILSIVAAISDYIIQFKKFSDSTEIFSTVMSFITSIVSNIATKLGYGLKEIATWISNIRNIDLSGLIAFKDKVLDCFTPIESVSSAIKNMFDGLMRAIYKLVPILLGFANTVWTTMTNISQSIINSMGGKGNALTNILSAGLIGGILIGIKKVINVFKELTENVGGIVDSVTEVFDGVKGSLEEFQNKLKANRLIKIATAVGILAGSLLILSTIDGPKLAAGLAALGGILAELVAAMTVLDKLDIDVKIGVGIIFLATSVLILSTAMQKLSSIPWDGIGKGLVSLGGILSMIVITSKTLETNSKGMLTTAISLNALALAINILVKAVEYLGKLNVPILINGLISLGVLLTELSLFMKFTDISGMSINKAAGLVIFASAMLLMSKAVESIGSIDVKTLIKGLGSIAALLLEISLFMKLVQNSGNMISTATSLVILGGSLLVMSSAIDKLGNMKSEVLAKGLLAVASSLIVIAGAMRIMPNDLMKQSVAMVALGASLLLIGESLKIMGNMTIEQIGKGLLTLAGSLTILAVAMNFMSSGIPGALALTAMAVALSLLVPSLVILGTLSLETIGTSLLAMAAAFTVVGVAGLLLGPLTPALLGLSAAIALLGVACLAVGAGISAFATGITLLAASGTIGIAALVLAISTVVGLIPMIATSIANGLVNIIKVFMDNTAIITKALVTLLVTIIEALTKAIPPLVKLVGTLLNSLLQLVIDIIPKVVEVLMTLITSVIKALSDNLPIIADMVFKAVLNIILTVLNNLSEAIPKIGAAVANIFISIINTIGVNVPRVVNAMYDLVINMINGLAESVETKMPQVRAAIKRLTTAIINEFKSVIKDAVDVGGNIVEGIKEGILSKVQSIVDAAKTIATSAIDAAKDFLGIHSPSRAFEALGMYSDQGLANGLYKYSNLVEDEAIGVADGALSGMRKAMDAVTDIINGDMDNQPVIRPVMDLTNIQNGAGQIGSLVNGNYAIQTSVNAAGRISRDMLSRNNSSDVSRISDTTNNTNNSITNTFNITGDDPRAIADEVSKIIQKQVERRNVVWA